MFTICFFAVKNVIGRVILWFVNKYYYEWTKCYQFLAKLYIIYHISYLIYHILIFNISYIISYNSYFIYNIYIIYQILISHISNIISHILLNQAPCPRRERPAGCFQFSNSTVSVCVLGCRYECRYSWQKTLIFRCKLLNKTQY